MARPRKYNLDIPGLYCSVDKRTNRVYWKYKHPLTGKMHGLGTDEKEARDIATIANQRLADQKLRNTLAVQDKIIRKLGGSITVDTWIDRYLEIQQERMDLKEIKVNTVKQRIGHARIMRNALSSIPIADVTTRDIVDIVEGYKAKGQMTMAKAVRTTIIDIFREAQHAGEVPPGYNPGEATKRVKVMIMRERIEFDEWKAIHDAAEDPFLYMQKAMLLALVTGQREGDISNMQFTHVWDGYLHVEQGKRGARVAIPLALRCEALGMTLGDVISICRDDILSPYLVHYTHNTSHARKGGKVSANTLSTNFKTLRDKANINWADGRTPATFHEIRSLSERLYRKQGIDTKELLGHRRQEQTDKYNDIRDKDWIRVAI